MRKLVFPTFWHGAIYLGSFIGVARLEISTKNLL